MAKRKPLKPPKPITSARRGRTDAEMLRLLQRIAERLDRIVPVEDLLPEPEPTPVAAPSKPPVPMRDRVSLVPHHRGPREAESSYGTLSQGGTDPAEFWSRRDEYANHQDRPARSGRRQAVTR